MTRLLLSASLCLLIATSMDAQQDPQFTQWFMEPASFNPAVAGNSELTCISGTYRNQWVGLDGDPNTSMLTAHTFVDPLKGGVLLSVYQDALGQEENMIARLGYAHHLEPLSNGAIVSAGLSASFFQKKLGNDWIYINGPTGTSGGAEFGDNTDWDPAIPRNGGSASVIDLDFGLFIRKPGSFYAGLSATHLLENDLENFSIQPRRHIYAMGGYTHSLDGDYLLLRTNVLAKTDLTATIADINVNVLWNQMVWGGVSWRPGDAIAPTVGFEYATSSKDRTSTSQQVFRLGYSFDSTTSELSNYSDGSHEVFLSYCFKFESIPATNRYANPRFL